MKKHLIFLFMIIPFWGLAQFQPPNYEGIGKIIKDSSSPYYFPALMERYEANDTTLSVQHYRILYYGYIFQDSYDPYGLPVQFDTLNRILAKPNLSTEDYQEIIDIEERVLEDYPFNLREISLLAKAYEEVGEDELALTTHDKFNKIARAILSTGDGRTIESAMHVTMNSHEYDILHFLDLEYGDKSEIIDNTYELLSVKDNSYQVDGIYFNVKKMFEYEEKFIKK